jgi:ADP-ribose pyrophosphatase YjhB (NUDIX family)
MKIYSKHTRYLVAVDCIVFGYDIAEKELKLLLVKRSFDPAKGKWSLAGGFVKERESVDEAASRILRKLTGLEEIWLRQSHAYGDCQRDPGARVISVAYYSLITIRDLDSEIVKKNGAHWRPVGKLPNLIFDHTGMYEKAIGDLQEQVRTSPVCFELLPEKFTLVQLQDLYEAINRKKSDKRNFRKKILSMGILEKLDDKEKETSKKGAYYFKFNREKFDSMKHGFYFPLEQN